MGFKEVAQVAVGMAGRSLFEMESRAEHDVFPDLFGRFFHESLTLAFGVGGAAQVLAERITKVRNVYLLEKFGAPEAIWELELVDFPAVVSTAAGGNRPVDNMPPFYVLAYLVRVE